MTTEKEKDEAVGLAAIAVAFLLTVPFAILYEGFVFSRLWRWFVVPQFNVAALSVTTAAGLSLIITYLRNQLRPKDTSRDKSEQLWAVIGQAWLVPTFFLASGWFLQWAGAR
jgi:hypothetical protein